MPILNVEFKFWLQVCVSKRKINYKWMFKDKKQNQSLQTIIVI